MPDRPALTTLRPYVTERQQDTLDTSRHHIPIGLGMGGFTRACACVRARALALVPILGVYSV